MGSLRRQEGYFLLDNRDTPGVPDEVARPLAPDLPMGFNRAGRLFEAPTVTCSHCQTVVVINPDRQRERPFCRKCNHYVCDSCGVVLAQTKECKTWKQFIEEYLERQVKQQQNNSSIILV